MFTHKSSYAWIKPISDGYKCLIKPVGEVPLQLRTTFIMD